MGLRGLLHGSAGEFFCEEIWHALFSLKYNPVTKSACAQAQILTSVRRSSQRRPAARSANGGRLSPETGRLNAGFSYLRCPVGTFAPSRPERCTRALISWLDRRSIARSIRRRQPS